METKQHDGKILDQEIKESKFSTSKVARALYVNRKTLYNWFEKSDLPESVANRVGKIIQVDLPTKYPGRFGAKSEEVTIPSTHIEIYWKEKYYNLLEKYTALLEETKK